MLNMPLWPVIFKTKKADECLFNYGKFKEILIFLKKRENDLFFR